MKGRCPSAIILLAGVLCLGSSGDVGTGDLAGEILDLPPPPPDWEPYVDSALIPLILGSPREIEEAPGDGASVEVLLAFWGRMAQVRADAEPSPATRERLLDGVEARPGLLPALLRFLPDTPEAHDRVRALLEGSPNLRRDDRARIEVRSWLMRRSRHFRRELIASATQAADEDGGIRGREDLEALSRLDWHAAEPVLKAHAAGQHPRLAVLSVALLHNHAVEAGRWEEVDVLRARLIKTAADRDAPGRGRDVAIDALMTSDWIGRDEWFLSLLGDGTLRRLHDGIYVLTPLQDAVARDPGRLIPRVAARIGNPDRTIHDNAVACLAHFHLGRARRDALEPLLPWIEDPTWSSAGSGWSPGYRLRILQSLDRFDMPDCIPGLMRVVREESGLYREAAARALSRYCAPESFTALREAFLREPEEARRRAVLRALVDCGALTDREVARAIVAFAHSASSAGGRAAIERVRTRSHDPEFRLEDDVSMGMLFSEEATPGEGAAALVLREMERLERDHPEAAWLMADMARTWDRDASRTWLLGRIEGGRGGAGDLLPLLQRRDAVAGRHEPRLRSWLSSGGTTAGLAAVLLGDRRAMIKLLSGDDPEALTAMLAAAALVREPLPIDRVGAWVAESGTLLGRAARRYLETEDGERAEALLESIPGSAPVILGYRPPPPRTNGAIRDMTFDVWEAMLREEVLDPKGPDEVHALLSRYLIHDVAVTNAGGEHLILRVWDDRATLTIHRERAGETVRTIPDDAVARFRETLELERVAALPSLIAPQITGPEYEYLRIDRSSGRRVLIRAFEDGTVGSPYGRLKEAFRSLRDAPPDGPAFRAVPPWA